VKGGRRRGQEEREGGLDKRRRKTAILDLIRTHRIGSQEALRGLLGERGIDVTQATLSRDMAELRLLKVMGPDGGAHYSLPEREQAAPLEGLLSTLFVSAEASGNLLVLKTMTGGAQAVGLAIDRAEWPEVIGTLAGDDTVLIVLRGPKDSPKARARLLELAGRA
jgi:transcriptional regulator of arginine metabolism